MMKAVCKFCLGPKEHYGPNLCTSDWHNKNPFDVGVIRKFASGATRDQDDTKHDYEGYLSPLVLERFGEYMTKHRTQADGTKRDSDNWTKGIPTAAYMKSLLRHVIEAWKAHRGFRVKESLEESLCAAIFNAQGYLFELLKGSEAYYAVRPSVSSDTLTPEEDKAWDDAQANGNKATEGNGATQEFRKHWGY